MIEKFRKRFIKITSLAFAFVLVLLCTITTCSSVYSLYRTRKIIINSFIEELAGNKVTESEDYNKNIRDSLRYFVLYGNENGLTDWDFDNIDTISESDRQYYYELAVDKEGYGYDVDSALFYKTVKTGKDILCVFIYSSPEAIQLRNTITFNILSSILCSAIGYLIAIYWSKTAIETYGENERKQKEFITDASHELKTPITVISTCLKLNEMENGKQKWIEKANHQVEKLSSLINRLVELSRLDEAGEALQKSTFDLSFVGEEVLESFKEMAMEKKVQIISQVQTDIMYHGDQELIQELFSIIMDNAIKYSPEGSDISFSLKKDKEILISCINEVENTEKIQTELLFERFYREDKSRNEKTGGFGIGLSLAKSIVTAHGGSIKAVSKDRNHLEIVVRL